VNGDDDYEVYLGYVWSMFMACLEYFWSILKNFEAFLECVVEGLYYVCIIFSMCIVCLDRVSVCSENVLSILEVWF